MGVFTSNIFSADTKESVLSELARLRKELAETQTRLQLYKSVSAELNSEMAVDAIIERTLRALHEVFPDLRIAPFFRWLPDNERILVVKVARTDDNGQVFGHLAIVSARTGAVTKLASIAVSSWLIGVASPLTVCPNLLARAMKSAIVTGVPSLMNSS